MGEQQPERHVQCRDLLCPGEGVGTVMGIGKPIYEAYAGRTIGNSHILAVNAFLPRHAAFRYKRSQAFFSQTGLSVQVPKQKVSTQKHDAGA